jgi:hypothetical protein
MTIPLATSSSCVATKTIPCSSRTWSMFSSFSRIVSHSSSSSSAQRPLNSLFIDQNSCCLVSQMDGHGYEIFTLIILVIDSTNISLKSRINSQILFYVYVRESMLSVFFIAQSGDSPYGILRKSLFDRKFVPIDSLTFLN